MCKQIEHGCVAILLTISANRTVFNKHGLSNTEERNKWYTRSLNLWNQDPSVKGSIVMVQNSRPFLYYKNIESIFFNHSKVHEIKQCGKPTNYMGEHELVSIHTAMGNSRVLKNATHIIKITGRYYIPGILTYISLLHSTKIIHLHGFAGGCQIMDCRKDVCKQLWRCPYTHYSNCEATIKRRMHKFSKSEKLELPSLYTAYTLTGSGGVAVSRLPE